MTNIVEDLWLRLYTILSMFAEKLAAVDPTLTCNLGHTSNDVFLLRGYLAFRRSADGDEVAVTADVQDNDQQLIITSDACMHDGRVVAEGPSAVVQLSQDKLSTETAINEWLREFEKFLLENEAALTEAASQLK